MTTFRCDCASEGCRLKLDVGSRKYSRGDKAVIPIRVVGYATDLHEIPTVWLDRPGLLALAATLRESGERLTKGQEEGS